MFTFGVGEEVIFKNLAATLFSLFPKQYYELICTAL